MPYLDRNKSYAGEGRIWRSTRVEVITKGNSKTAFLDISMEL